MSVGPTNAKITIVKFSDFQCPMCKRGALGIHPILSQYKNEIRFIVKNYPLDPKCNVEIKSAGHPNACVAARAAYCAAQQGQFMKIYEKFFDEQEKLNQESEIIPMALSAAQLNEADLRACMASDEVNAVISRSVEEGKELEVQGTPTFFINGYKVYGVPTPDIWKQLIEKVKDSSPK